MDRNLKLLDRFDRDKNIYELICRLAARAHSIMSGSAASFETKETDPIQLAMEEPLQTEEGKQ